MGTNGKMLSPTKIQSKFALPNASCRPQYTNDLSSAANDGLGNIDRVVLGYEIIEDQNPNIVMGRNVNYSKGERIVTYYTPEKNNVGSIKFEQLKKLSKKVYGEKKN